MRMKMSSLIPVPAWALALIMCHGTPAAANKVFVSNEKGNTVTVIDSESWEVIAEFNAGNRPRGITISPDGKELYVCASDDDVVRVFDTETYRELHTLPSGPDPELFVLHPSGNPLYIADEDDNLVELDLTAAHFKGLSLHVVFMLIPMIYNQGREQHGNILAELTAIAEAGNLRPVLDEPGFKLEQAGDAHARLSSGKAMGKVVVEV